MSSYSINLVRLWSPIMPSLSTILRLRRERRKKIEVYNILTYGVDFIALKFIRRTWIFEF